MFLTGEENKKLLLDLQAVDPLLTLMQGEDATVRRHATMALGVMCQHRMYSLIFWYSIMLELSLIVQCKALHPQALVIFL